MKTAVSFFSLCILITLLSSCQKEELKPVLYTDLPLDEPVAFGQPADHPADLSSVPGVQALDKIDDHQCKTVFINGSGWVVFERRENGSIFEYGEFERINFNQERGCTVSYEVVHYPNSEKTGASEIKTAIGTLKLRAVGFLQGTEISMIEAGTGSFEEARGYLYRNTGLQPEPSALRSGMTNLSLYGEICLPL